MRISDYAGWLVVLVGVACLVAFAVSREANSEEYGQSRVVVPDLPVSAGGE